MIDCVPNDASIEPRYVEEIDATGVTRGYTVLITQPDRFFENGAIGDLSKTVLAGATQVDVGIDCKLAIPFMCNSEVLYDCTR